MTITDTYYLHAKHSPNRIAIKTKNELITYEQWFRLVSLTCSWLQAQPAKTKRIGILLPNGLSFLQVFTGAAHAGWTAVPLDVKWSLSELQDRIEICKPDIIIISDQRFESLAQTNHHVLHIDEFHEALHEVVPNFTQPVVSEEEPFYMGFTSGSTGKPKAFIRSHRSWVKSFDCNIVDFHMKEEEHVLVPGALIHSHFLYGAISTLFLGGTVHLLESFNPSMTLNILESEPISVLYSVPTMVEAILKEEKRITRPFKIFSSGAKWEKESKAKLQLLFPSAMLYEFYGASELSFVSVLTQKDFSRKSTSVGKPCHNVEIKVVINEEEVAAPNEIGKIFVKSEMIFIGYLTSPDEMPPQRTEEWMSVGDMGYLDEDGFLYIMGRENSMILYGGINIFPEEVESVLHSHSKVEEVAVIGTPDPYWGEIVTAVIKGTSEQRELRRYCKGKLANYKIPRKWIFVDELPHTTGGKIARVEVRKMLADGVVKK
ncbi:acyl-CoA synthetase [Heyndrickxia shackletonii]|uniref:Acyl-CoA synthetase n=1 Tax=Heyndrickxia shackletonii TaxID=157838 RepID=A0A0Q3TBA7_9BACI|nr:AMP-binding protein [Heyndrickxia shackletonii]KQL51448.1 acyl-CoA synthetase [Heyndrickxia shackletonii]NEZ00794.1 AMP-binding protein [Heyndrickxia shackletonii]